MKYKNTFWTTTFVLITAYGVNANTTIPAPGTTGFRTADALPDTYTPAAVTAPSHDQWTEKLKQIIGAVVDMKNNTNETYAGRTPAPAAPDVRIASTGSRISLTIMPYDAGPVTVNLLAVDAASSTELYNGRTGKDNVAIEYTVKPGLYLLLVSTDTTQQLHRVMITM